MRIAVDADGVLWRLNDAVLPVVELLTGNRIDALDLSEWDWFRRRGVHPSQFYKACSLFGKGSMHKAIEPYDEHTFDAVRAIAAGHELFVLTAMTEDRVAGLERWLAYHGIADCFTGIEVAQSAVSKYDHRFDMLVDDCPLLPAEAHRRGDDRHLALMHAPWNRRVRSAPSLPAGVRPTDGWLDLETFIYSFGT